jgi:hypothetical protein
MEIIIDFDGTCVTHEFPRVGKDIGAVPVLKKLTDNGHKLILFTMRSNRIDNMPTGDDNIQNVTGQFLDDAVNWFKQRDIPLYGIQTNPKQYLWTTSPKAYGQLYIDDAALGCPLKYEPSLSRNAFVDWKKVKRILTKKKLI